MRTRRRLRPAASGAALVVAAADSIGAALDRDTGARQPVHDAAPASLWQRRDPARPRDPSPRQLRDAVAGSRPRTDGVAPSHRAAAARDVIVDTNEPLPRAVKVAALVMVLLALGGAAYFMFVSQQPAEQRRRRRSSTVPVAVPSGVDKETMLKAALHDLTNGETCADRKAGDSDPRQARRRACNRSAQESAEPLPRRRAWHRQQQHERMPED